MTYKEPKLDKEGVKAIYDAFTKANDEVTKKRKSTKKEKPKKN